MKYLEIGPEKKRASSVMLGCMRISELSGAEVEKLVETALEAGIDSFDHADIYGGGKSEELFGKLLAEKPSLRDKIILQSKCGIRSGFFDFSKQHILDSVDGCLRRLHADRLDYLLLHRPDALMEPDEVAEAFAALKSSGKVTSFGVSNMNPFQMELLQKSLDFPLEINQLQLSAAYTVMIDEGFNVNMCCEGGVVRDGGILDYCRLHDITVQSWSSLQYGFFEGTFLGSDRYPELNVTLDRMAAERGVTNGAVAIAWILRHPAKMQAIVGSTSAQRVAQLAKAMEIQLSREEWYEIYRAAGNKLP